MNKQTTNTANRPGKIGMIQKPKNIKETTKRFLKYFKPYKIIFIGVILLIIVSTLLTVVTPKLLGDATTSIFDSITGNRPIDFEELKTILFFLIGINIVGNGFYYLGQFIISKYSQKITYNLRKEVNKKLSKLPIKYYDRANFGDFISRVTNDIDNISNALQQGLTTLISSLVMIVGIIYMMISINFYMTLIALSSLGVSFLAAKIIVTRSQKYFKQKQDLLGKLNGDIEETFSSMISIKSYNKEEDAIKKFTKLNSKLRKKDIISDFLSSLILPLVTFVSNISYVVISIVGALFLIDGKITIGNIQAFLQYTKNFSMPVGQIASISNTLQSTIASAERVFELLDEPEGAIVSGQKMPKKLQGNIIFENVKFGYTKNKTVMKNVNFEVTAGETVAIIGPTGAGKTTLVNVLMRFYDIESGKITIDGINTQDMKRSDLRKHFAMVLQNTWLFHGSIYENIAYGRSDSVTKEEVIAAAKIAKANHFIMTQPKGYETIINEEGSNISAGQKQLITIARAVLAHADILILDEATSSVDTRTEALIKEGLDNLSKNKTTFIIAHRLSTIRNADKVILMEHGDIIDIGSYEQVVLNRM